MQVRSVSQLSSIPVDGSSGGEIDVMKGKQTYVEVSIRRDNGEGYDSFRCDFTNFLQQIQSTIYNLNEYLEQLCDYVDSNFVHKTAWGEGPEEIFGVKVFNDKLLAANGAIAALSCQSLTVDTQLSAVELTASNIHTNGLTATISPADLTAKVALWK